MCPDGKCGNCPKCHKKKEMMAIGYSEAAVDAVFDDTDSAVCREAGTLG